MSKEEIISEIVEMLHIMYYEDLQFFHGMIAGLLRKQGQKAGE